MPEVSVVIPVRNEAANVRPLLVALCQVLQRYDYEIIFVDDGSADSTVNAILSLKTLNIRVIELRRNFGKAVALQTGFSRASGKYVITMDGDLQDDPAEIPRFLVKLAEGYDLVSGWKIRRKDPLSKILPSKIFNLLTSAVTGVKLHDFNCGFKAYRHEVTKALHLYGELHRYIPALAHWKGFRVAEIPVNHHPRKHGKSKYGFSRLFKGLFDLITVRYLTHYSDRPLHLFGSIGLSLSAFGFFAGVYLTYLWHLDVVIWNRPLLILSVLLMILGVQFFFFGLIAEMIATSQKVSDVVRREY